MNTIQKTKYDGIIFDMDGVLIDVRNSYRVAIRQTAQQFVKKIVTDSDVAQIKTIAGLNNDWDATALLIQLKNNRSIAMQEIKQLESIRTSPLYKQVVEYFDALYLGTTLFEKKYASKSPLQNKNGLINKEKAMVDQLFLKRLKQKYAKLALVTGRPRFDTQITLKRFKYECLLDSVITSDDVINDKPDPEELLKTITKLHLRNPLFIGDTINDKQAAQNAQISFLLVRNPDQIVYQLQKELL